MVQFPALAAVPGLRHGITTRHGGVSETPFHSLNLGMHVEDHSHHVQQNRRIAAQKLGYDATQLVAAQQVHGTHTQTVDAAHRGQGALDWESALPGTDALATATPNVPLLILVADCAPILLAAPRERALAVVHAGWRGALGGIAGNATRTLQTSYGTAPETIHVGIGPCLCPGCLEIGPEVAEQIQAVAPQTLHQGPKKPHLDLRALIRHDLQGQGVPENQIETLDICPRCQNQEFFSHRAENGKTGRFGLVAWWG